MKFAQTVLAASLAMIVAAQAHAAVSAQETAKLGSSLTLVGAEKAGNADGSIPAYDGGLTTPPASFKAGDSMRPDPFAKEKPLLVIDGKNVDQYKGQLTATTAELAKRFPTFKVEVYPTHRTVLYGSSRPTSRPALVTSTRGVASTLTKTAGPLWPRTNMTPVVSSTAVRLPSSAKAMTSRYLTPRRS